MQNNWECGFVQRKNITGVFVSSAAAITASAKGSEGDVNIPTQ